MGKKNSRTSIKDDTRMIRREDAERELAQTLVSKRSTRSGDKKN